MTKTLRETKKFKQLRKQYFIEQKKEEIWDILEGIGFFAILWGMAWGIAWVWKKYPEMFGAILLWIILLSFGAFVVFAIYCWITNNWERAEARAKQEVCQKWEA